MGFKMSTLNKKSSHKSSHQLNFLYQQYQSEWLINNFIGWLNQDTSVLDFYNKLSHNGTIHVYDINEYHLQDQATLLHLGPL